MRRDVNITIADALTVSMPMPPLTIASVMNRMSNARMP